MNTEYIRMCWKASEDLEKHIPHEMDDLWCDGHSVYIRMPVIIDSELIQGEFIDHVKYKLNEPFECEEFVVWRQEDLQEMIINYNPEFTNQDKLLDDFMAGWGNYTGIYKDLNMLWLGFIMEYMFGKGWNSEQGVWEVIE